jgi:hypothetical protein
MATFIKISFPVYVSGGRVRSLVEPRERHDQPQGGLSQGASSPQQGVSRPQRVTADEPAERPVESAALPFMMNPAPPLMIRRAGLPHSGHLRRG